jgi:aldehyde dehydrogenase
VEDLVLYAFNKGEVCTCPSRALIQESIHEKFMALCLDRIGRVQAGNPLDTETMIGPQVSAQQFAKLTSCVEIGKDEGAEVLALSSGFTTYAAGTNLIHRCPDR